MQTLRLNAPANNQLVQLAHSVAWGTSSIALLIGILGIANTMAMSVFERTREIGILRALGWKGRHVILLILTEAAALGVGRRTAWHWRRMGGVAVARYPCRRPQALFRLPFRRFIWSSRFSSRLPRESSPEPTRPGAARVFLQWRHCAMSSPTLEVREA